MKSVTTQQFRKLLNKLPKDTQKQGKKFILNLEKKSELS
jgi:mRNA-degrading endonuclease RelE of RelBE toxin-antitoxin system